jgi:myo-inositol-1(or 4)-monophosphatase
MLEAARHAANSAAELLLSYSGKISEAQISSKSSGVDLVSIADVEAEQLIRYVLARARPGADFLGEESARPDTPPAEYCWIVDPLDGTSNFLAGLPIWSVSIALADRHKRPLAGIVLAPALSCCWEALLGGGCRRNGAPSTVRSMPPGGGLNNAMLATGFPYAVSGGRSDINIDNFIHMQRRFHKIRRLGSAAIDLAYLASGIFDGMWELSLQPWDSAAGILLVTEAGGCVSRFDGSPYSPGDEDLLAAATPALLAELQGELAAAARYA